jgi:hypothetical protein
VIEGRAWRSEGTEANNFNAVYGAWPWAGNFFKRPLKHWSLQATISHRPIALVPEGWSLDRCVILNCGDSGVVQLHRTACITRFNVDCMRALS